MIVLGLGLFALFSGWGICLDMLRRRNINLKFSFNKYLLNYLNVQIGAVLLNSMLEMLSDEDGNISTAVMVVAIWAVLSGTVHNIASILGLHGRMSLVVKVLTAPATIASSIGRCINGAVLSLFGRRAVAA